MNKVFILPELQHAPFGIKRVLEALHEYLPEFGWEIVHNPDDADVVNLHAMMDIDTDKPIVHSSHGLYWAEFDWPADHLWANAKMVEVMTKAKAITTPSNWVRGAIARGISRPITAIHHGVDADKFNPGESQGYVLWNKARADIVSNPEEMQKLAELMPGVGFVSTIGKQTKNVQVIGVLPYERMMDVVAKASVYLATARETFGIGTLEALACGVPVAGWNHGGQTEIVTQGETGYLAPFGDYEALAQCVQRCLTERERLSKNARMDIISRWQWGDKVEQYAKVFASVLPQPGPKVSIVITAHNLAKYLPDALDSVKAQDMDDWECLIVDDASTDNTAEVVAPYLDDDRFQYLPTPHNLKLSGARNYGMERANGRYLLPLDADDALYSTALSSLASFLDDHPDKHIAYGGLDIMSEDGSGLRGNDWPFPAFSWLGQIAHLNQIPYCSMMHKSVWRGIGGYRVRDWRAEDASFWLRASSLGFHVGRATDDSILKYRLRPDSKGATERNEGHDDGDWTSWFPWRLGAANSQEGWNALKQGKRPNPAIVPFGAQGDAPKYCWPVWSHHNPLVSVIIPCGPNHAHLLIDALDSIQAQIFPFWEAIVVNDTGGELDLSFAPWCRVIEKEGTGIAASRNAGLYSARAPLVLFLDADDLLTPSAIYDMIEAYSDSGRYIYTDWYAVMPDKTEAKSAKPYDRSTEKGMSHSITSLIPRQWALDVGGFDEDLPGWEDWEFFIKLAVNGYCGERLAKPCFVYRMHTGERREQSLADKDETLPILKERYGHYFEKGGQAMPPCCGDGGPVILEAKKYMSKLSNQPTTSVQVASSGLVRLEYIGNNAGGITMSKVGGVKLSKTYRLGKLPPNNYVDATPADAELLVSAGRCRYVKQPGIDLKQAVVTAPPVVEKPVPPPPKELPDLQSKNVGAAKRALLGLNMDELAKVRKQEVEGKNRTTVLKAIDTLLADGSRVG